MTTGDPGMPPGAPPPPPPQQYPGASPPMDRTRAASLVKGPGVTLIVLASLGLLVSLFSFLLNLVVGPEEAIGFYKKVAPQVDWSQLEPQLRSQFSGTSRVLNMVLSFLYVVPYAFALFGLIRMVKLRSWGLALTGVILAMLPNPGSMCCCCLFTIPIGIWAIVVLAKPEVKAAFS